MSPGELRQRHRESHLCFRCAHEPMCIVARAAPEELLVTITSCLGFVDVMEPVMEPAEEAPAT